MLVIPHGIFAQDDLNIHGVVSDAMTSSKLGDVKVTVKKDGSVHDNYTTRANGKYEFYLDCGSQYEFVFEKSGFVKRSIMINSKGVPEEVIGAGIIMPTDMSMYEITEAMADADLSVFDKPIGKASYDPAQADLVWDFAYTNQVKGEIFKFIRDVEKKQKELEKEATAEEKAALELEEKFNEFVQKGDDAIRDDDYEDAVLNYQAALDLKPGDGAVQAKLGDAQTKWNARKAQQKLDADYSAALDAGDSFMRTEEYEKAVEKYKEALELRPEESYPQDQITEAERIIEELAAALANQEQFNKIMAEADGLSDEEKYAEAISKYEEALVVIPGNSEAENKLSNAQDALANLEAKAARQAEYDEAIASADEAFSSEQFEEAMAAYEKAADIFPDEAYPQTQIELCETKLEELANAAEKQQNFNDLVAEGDEAMSETDFENAVSKYQEALKVIPNEEPAVSKLAEAQGLLDELVADQQKQENYDALIEEADDALSNESYDLAKTKYQEAKAVLPEKTYPLDQITKIDAILAELADERATQEAYNVAMAAGASSMESQEYQAAVGHFQDALQAISEDKDATKALEDANAALAEQQANMAQQEQYDALIASADTKFDKSKWTEAIADYSAALEILSDETYPQERIEAANAKIEKEKAEAEAAELKNTFDALVAEGDAALNSKDFDTSISKYEEALDLLDSEEVEAKIAAAEEAKKAYLEKQGQQEQYNDAIARADELFQGKDWVKAIERYEEAQTIKPDESYPSDQIALANEEIKAAEEAAQAELQAQFDGLVAKGDKLLEENSFDPSIDKYKEALAIKESAEVEDKIANAEKLKEEFKKLQSLGEQYDEAIANADALFAEKAWLEAKSSYEVAVELKSEEQYPKDRIALINENIAAEEAELQAEFDALVDGGDKFIDNKSFDEGIAQYELALNIMESTEVEDKIAAAQSARNQFEDAQAKQKRYDEIIAEADVDFGQDSWDEARALYETAAEILADESYPKDQIALIEQKIAEADEASLAALQAEREAKVNALVIEGDEHFGQSEYAAAVAKYEEALGILPERADVSEKLSDAEAALLALEESKALEQAYMDAIDEGNAAFDTQEWEKALASYEAAVEIKPNEPYPKERIDEVNLKLDAIAEAERLEREAELKKDFDKLIAAGDKLFNKTKFENALEEYQLALNLLPDNELAKQKVKAAQEALGEIEADRAAMNNYNAAIDEGDELFKSESYEMAKLKYADASDIMPSEEYPKNKMVEIDLILEKQRLKELAGEKEALNRAYQTAIDKGDEAFASKTYDKARAAYNEAIELKPDETYPKGQLERIDLKIEEAANAKREQERLAALEEERRRAEEKRREDLSRVNSESEDQAERFMREAREAEANERYKRIQKMKIQEEENIDQYQSQSGELRAENYLIFQGYRRKFSDQYSEAMKLQAAKVGNSVKYKKALLGSSGRSEEMDEVRNSDQYDEILALEKEIATWKAEMSAAEKKLIRQEREKAAEILADSELQASMNYSERVTANKEFQSRAEERYRESEQLAQQRRDKAAEIKKQNEEYNDYLADMNEKSLKNAKQNKQDLNERYAGRDAQNGTSNDVYRSELAENYPQGVTEESSTLGNKVIITRIVVSGKNGDEFKKVVDKAGSYYFKNGHSISENTWNRETIDAFNKRKD